MKNDRLNTLTYLDEALIEKAESYVPTRKKRRWIKWAAIAACIPLIVTGTAFARENMRYNAAVTYLTSLGIPAEDLSDYSRNEIKEAAQIIEAKEPLEDGQSNALVEAYYASETDPVETSDTPAKVSSDQIRKRKPTMTRAEVLRFLGDTQDVGSGIYIYVYEVDGKNLPNIPFANDNAQLGVSGADLLKALRPIEE